MNDLWKELYLKDIAEVISSNVDKHIKESEKKVRLFNYMDVYSRNFADNDSNLSIGSAKENELSRFSLRENDVLITKDSETPEDIARSCVVLRDLDNVVCGYHIAILRGKKDKISGRFLKYLFDVPSFHAYFSSLANGATRFGLSKSSIEKAIIRLPSLFEQERIVSILEIFDGYLEALGKEVKAKKNIKNHLMQTLLLGKIRLKGFKKEWQTYELGQTLKYEQPGKYIVQSTDYINNGIPVLTANKSFILGYTDEEDGVYDKLPVIIFDDFTTLSKFVDFPFKVKSSAMKILKPKSNEFDIKFIYERMQLLKYVVGEHKRCYLSEYQYLDIKVPEIKEQQAIASILSSTDKEIETLETKKKLIEQQRKYLLNNLITGNIRVPETIGNNLN